MTCPACLSYDAAERAAIEGRELPPHSLTCTCEPLPVLDVLLLSPAVLRDGRVHIGRAFTFDSFDEFSLYLSRPTFVVPTVDPEIDKASEGGIVCGAFTDNRRRKASFIRTRIASFDFDGASCEDVALAARGVSACVHETFKSKAGARRCRLYVELREAVDLAAFDRAHAVMRKHFAARGIVADESAKDCSRLNYVPVRATGSGYQFSRIAGEPLDVARMLAAQPPPAPRSATRLSPLPQHRDKYISAALAKARANVAAANPGGRHLALLREAFSLARLDLTESEIADALLPAFVAAAGEARRREGERAIRDGVREGRSAA